MDNHKSSQPIYREAVHIIKNAILDAQYKAIKTVHEHQLSLYFSVGCYVSKNSRNNYWGTGALKVISEQLQNEIPGLRGFSAENIKKMRIFYEEWSFLAKRSPLANEIENSELSTGNFDQVNRSPMANNFDYVDFLSLSFTHHMEILHKTVSQEERLFYIKKAVEYRWSKYVLRKHLEDQLFYNQGSLPNNFHQTLPDRVQRLRAIEMFKDEYMLDFINIEELGERDEDDIDEKIVENAIVNNVKNFIMAFGRDFTFIGNQYRIEVMSETFVIDLLFYNRELGSLVAVELKKGKFKTSYLGQLNTYLRLLDDFVRKPKENPSIGILLCKEANKTIVEYAIRDFDKPMGVATYRTAEEMPEEIKKALPNVDELKKIL